MSLVQYKDALLVFVSQWTGTTAPRLLAAFVGSLLVVLLIQAVWARRVRVVPATTENAPSDSPHPAHGSRRASGAQMAAMAVIVFSGIAVLWTGWRTPEPMIGDEVTHFYMLHRQSRQLTVPNFCADIPVGWSSQPETRRYPHVSGWHYLGALVYRISGESVRAVQLWHTLFWVQLLVVAYLLARRRGGDHSHASVLFLILLASLPAAVIFSVAFYQDIPATAQVLTAFYLLFCGRRWSAMVFLLLAMAIKETAFLFVPAFMFLWGWTIWQQHAATDFARRRLRRSAVVSAAMAGLVIALYCLAWAEVLHRYAQSNFYPVTTLQETWRAWRQRITTLGSGSATPSSGAVDRAAVGTAPKPSVLVTPYETHIIANHPGDLRVPRNYVIFGGILVWLIAAVGLIVRAVLRLRRRPALGDSTGWLWGIGLSYVIPAAYVLRTAPDARFFLPAVPFLLLPLAEWAVCAPRVKGWLALLTALALLQVGAVYGKVYRLRAVTPALREAIAYLRDNPPTPRTVFMYPEGNYRIFPTPHEWYLGYHLREFWNGNNDLRISMLNRYHIGAIVIKKYLIADVDGRITDLGVYPTFFVKDVEHDARFSKAFDNDQVAIYLVPPQQP